MAESYLGTYPDGSVHNKKSEIEAVKSGNIAIVEMYPIEMVILNNIDLLKEPLGDDQKVYGNIGQDIIQKFVKMTLNFNKMFIKFD